MTDFIYYSTFAVTVGLALAAFVAARTAVAKGADLTSSSNRLALAAIASGLFSGMPYFQGAIWIAHAAGYSVHTGHGLALVAAALFNALLGLALAALGRMVLRWQPVKW
jgi:hypothetical protein